MHDILQQLSTALMKQCEGGGAAKITQAVFVPQEPYQLQGYNLKDKANNWVLIFPKGLLYYSFLHFKI